MTSNSDVTVCNPIAIKLQIISCDLCNGSDSAVAAVSAAANASVERDDQHCPPKQHKIKRKRGYKHDENATVFITQEDVDTINTSSTSNHENSVLLSDGMVCRLSKTHNGSLLKSLLKKRGDRMTAVAAQERSSLFSGVDANVIDQLWAPVILRVLPSSLLDTSSATIHTQSKEFTPIIFIPPCISAAIGIHWFCRNNTQAMSAYIHPLPRNRIAKASSATVREIGHLSPLMMDTFNSWHDTDSTDNTKADNGGSIDKNKSIAEEEEIQLRRYFLSKRQDPNAEKEQHLHPSCRTTTTAPLWKPRQRLLTIGSIFATPVVSTYCDCYNRLFHGGYCKESLDNVRLYQVVDIQSSQKSEEEDEMDNNSDNVLLDKNRGELAYTISPLTHLTLQPKQTDVGLHEYGYTWRLPRPSFILSYLQSIDNSFTKHSSQSSTFEGVSNWISESNHDAIYHPSAKSLVDAIYLQGVIATKSTESALRSTSPRIIHVIGESENNIRGCIDEAADMMGMRSLHVGGLAAFLVHYSSIYNRDDSKSILTGGLSDKLKGLAASLEIANQCAPCLVHIEDLDHELTPTTGQMADASGREEEERRILQVLGDKTASSRCFTTSTSFESSRIGHNVFLSSCTAPKVVVVFSTSESLPPGPISSSLQQTSISINPPDTSYARALWGHDADGTFEPLSASLVGHSARDIGYLRQRFVHEWTKRSPSDADSEATALTPISILEPILNELEASRSFTQPSRKGGAGGSNTLPLATSSLPNVRWEDVGGMDNIRKEIMDAVELPLKYPHFFKGKQRSGILLFGPPGTGKTLVAKAVARECGLPFLSIKGPELLGSYVGESEANIRAVFDAARSAALNSSGSGSSGYSGASVLFFDELDSLAPRRGDTGFGDGVMDRVVSTLLGELDGGEAKSSTKGIVEARIIVIGATNRPDLLDPSLLRPGRFDRLLYLGPAKTKDTMLKILKAQTRKFRFEPGTDPDSILQEAMESFPTTLSGADLSAVASKALMRGLRRVCDQVEREAESLNRNKDPSEMKVGIDDVMETWSKEELEPVMCVEDFVEAAQNIVPSISQKDLDNFEKLQQQFASR